MNLEHGERSELGRRNARSQARPVTNLEYGERSELGRRNARSMEGDPS